jgi:Flp pilus assembly protein TadD/4-amino-4-deoxy-L-arabinose transferase-like glycosyltransferase
MRVQRFDTNRSPATSRREAWALGLIAVIAFGIRLTHARALNDSPISEILLGDSRRYVDWAREIAAGDWVGTEVFYQAPLYPYVLAVLFRLFGESVDHIRLVQVAFGSASCLLLALAGRRFFGWMAGLTAGGLLAIFPTAIFFDGLIQKSSLDLLLMTALLLTVAEYATRPRRGWLVGMGVALGCLLICRENARVLYPFLAGWLLIQPRAHAVTARVVAAMIFTAGTALPVAPVAIRNHVVGGDLLLSTSQLGPNFYIGNRHGASGAYDPLVPGRGNVKFEREDAARLASAELGRALSAGEVSKYWLEKALDEIWADPWEWALLMARKSLLAIHTTESMDTESVAFHRSYSAQLQITSWFTFGLLLPLAVAGVWVTRHDWRTLIVLYGIFILMLVSVIVFFVLDRYRFPVVPIALLFAAVAVTRWREWTRMSTATAVGAVLTGSVALVSNWPIAVPPDASPGNFGTELLRENQPHAAIPFLEQAVEISPEPQDLYDLSQGYARAGRLDRAASVLGRLVRMEPQDAENQRELAVTLLGLGRSEEALEAARRAATLQPESATMVEVLGSAMLANGQLEAAAERFRRALELDPNHATAHNNLANLLVQSGAPAEAMAHYRRAIELAPENVQAMSNLAMTLELMGNAEEAVRTLRRAVSLRPTHAQLRLNLADLLLRTHGPAEARAEYEAVLLSNDSDPKISVAVRVRLAWGLVQEGRRADALALLGEASAIARRAGMKAELAEVDATMRTMAK